VNHRPLTRTLICILALLLGPGLSLPYDGLAQVGSAPLSLSSIRVGRFPLISTDWTTLRGPARAGEYMGAVGTKAAWLGSENGMGEVWIHPLKVAREISLSFKIPDYSDPIPGASVARRVEVGPETQTIVYSHAGFQVKQHVLAPRNRPGIILLLEVDAVVELEIHVEFQPVMQYAWPGGMGGQNLFWDAENCVFILSESLRKRNAVIGSPWATEASAHPAHQLAEAPSTFIIPVDPVRSRSEFIPIVITGGTTPRDEVLDDYRALLQDAESLYLENRRWAEGLRADYLSLSLGPAGRPGALAGEMPEGRPEREASQTGNSAAHSGAAFPRALEWAKVNLEEQRSCNPDLGCGLVAGWGPSGTSLRPGFGWFFGGDAAINTLAMDATGQWELVAEGLRFLAQYQRADGKIPHEISQSAGTIPWFDDFPYAYYHADTTPYWMLALWHYWKASGDDALVRELWPAFLKAYEWCLSVETDGDGIIENTTGGLGAIEVGGIGEGIHQDIYLAAVWVEALGGTIQMAEFMGDRATRSEAQGLLHLASETLNTRYWRPEEGHLAFGILRDGSTNDNLTAWPGTALSFGLLEVEQAEGTLRHLARDAISSSWGARLLSSESELYHPLHYNMGAVWPFMTGFVSWAQYRYRRPWAGFPLLRALQKLTEDFSLGRHPENLSGAYYQTMDATVPHQFFATSMLVTPLARGLIGWEPNAPEGKATLAPQPPPSWNLMGVEELKVGESTIVLVHLREAFGARVYLSLTGPPVELTYIQSIPLGAREVRMEGGVPGMDQSQGHGLHDQSYQLTFPLEEGDMVDLRFSWEGGMAVEPPDLPLEIGAESGGLRVLDFTMEAGEWVLLLEGDGGETHEVTLFGPPVEREGGGILSPQGPQNTIIFPVSFEGTGRSKKTVRLKPVGVGGMRP